MATTKGTAIIWGVSTTNMTGFSAAVSAGYTFTEESVGKEADEVLIKNSVGETTTAYYYNGRKTLSLKCYPSGGSASAVSQPAAGETVTVTASTDADINGNWICQSSTKSRTSEGIVEFDLSLINFDGITE